MATTLAQLRTRAQRRADLETSQFVVNTEWNDEINVARRELFDILVDLNEGAFDAYLSFSATKDAAGYYYYTLGTSPVVYRIRGLEKLDGTSYLSVPKLAFGNRNEATSLSYVLTGYASNGTLYFYPRDAVATTDTFRIWVTQRPSDLSADGDMITEMESQWDEFIVLGAAISRLDKEESPTDHLVAARMRYKAHIETMARTRDANEPRAITDVDFEESPWAVLPKAL